MGCCDQLIKKPIFWLKILEMVFGIAVSAMFTVTYNYFSYSWNNNGAYSEYKYALQTDLAIVSANGFLYINIIIFIGLCAEKDFERNILHPIFAFIGVLVSAAAGGIVLNNTLAVGDKSYWEINFNKMQGLIGNSKPLGNTETFYLDNYAYRPTLATGILFVIYAAMYAADFIIYFAVSRRRKQEKDLKYVPLATSRF